MGVRVAVVAGSTRSGSFAKQLGRAAAAQIVAAGGDAEFVDLRDYAMPLYDGDLEEAHGLPEGALKLRELLKRCDALLVVSPEYNASIPAVLKNAIDWLSRPHAAEPDVAVLRGKVAALLSSSPGALGGMRGLVHLRQILMNLGMLVVTEQFALGGAGKAFADGGALADDGHRAAVDKVVTALVRTAAALRAN
ncbi:MAG: NAD(P)H-dependent oxidoreductase [Planctomycetota bacterium]